MQMLFSTDLTVQPRHSDVQMPLLNEAVFLLYIVVQKIILLKSFVFRVIISPDILPSAIVSNAEQNSTTKFSISEMYEYSV